LPRFLRSGPRATERIGSSGWESLREFRGKFFADATAGGDSRRPIVTAILDHEFTRINYVHTRYRSIQWLEDSIVFVEQDPSSSLLTEKVVRSRQRPARGASVSVEAGRRRGGEVRKGQAAFSSGVGFPAAFFLGKTFTTVFTTDGTSMGRSRRGS
jgi:hypothetical protein